ncbi:MAG: glycosyltransferase family 2 protein [Dehalococcoidia bacterium]|nr:glycosyltransferase family 2 protein [Dehalococcoidia bacterium]
MLPVVSVVIATRNRPGALRRCIESILQSEFQNFEVVIVNQSEDHLLAETPAFADVRVRHYYQSGRGKARALNEGILRALAPTLAFTDDDCTVPPDWLRDGLAECTRSGHMALVYGTLRAGSHADPEASIPEFLPGQRRVRRGRPRGRLPFLGVGANMWAPKAMMEALGGFDVALGPGSDLLMAEDLDVAYRALRAGYSVVTEPSLEVTHWGARTVRNRDQDWYVGGTFAVGASHARRLREGDLWAGWLLVAKLSDFAVGAYRALTRRHPSQIRSSVAFYRGVLAGWRSPRSGFLERQSAATPVDGRDMRAE